MAFIHNEVASTLSLMQLGCCSGHDGDVGKLEGSVPIADKSIRTHNGHSRGLRDEHVQNIHNRVVAPTLGSVPLQMHCTYHMGKA